MKGCLSEIKDSLYGASVVRLKHFILYRLIFGVVCLVSTLRYLAYGWPEKLLIEPEYHFKYSWFPWIGVPDAHLLYTLFAVQIISLVFFISGRLGRMAIAIFGICFTYIELIDKTLYLNHYYLVSLLCVLFALCPATSVPITYGRHQEIDDRWIDGWQIQLFRKMSAIVYIYAGIWKLNPDWIFRAQPLKTWSYPLSLHPTYGFIFEFEVVPYLMSWFGAVFDVMVIFLLSLQRTRQLAFVLAVSFHLTIWMLFPVGIFSFVMLLCATSFLLPTRYNVQEHAPSLRGQILSVYKLWFIRLFFMIQIVTPLRGTLYPGNPNWTEHGYRFSWRVMLNEKAGDVRFRYRHADDEGWAEWNYLRHLTPLQIKQMSFQPDMIYQYARYICEAEGRDDLDKTIDVRADVMVSWNGRRAVQLFMDANICSAEDPYHMLIRSPGD